MNLETTPADAATSLTFVFTDEHKPLQDNLHADVPLIILTFTECI